ncbi:hypothetical protein ACHAXR_008479 [Thalassiosira sp. AJA248-18]
MSNAMLQRYSQANRSGGSAYPPPRVPAGVQSTAGLAPPPSSSSAASNPMVAVRSHPGVVAQPSFSASLHQRAQKVAPPNAQTAAYTTALKGNSYENHHHNNKQQQCGTQKSLAYALLPDLPLLMHGSGDVLPENVHPHSVATLAKLIEKHVASLVSAAMDAHDVFTDGEVVGGGACLGVPPFGATAAAGSGESDDDDEANNDGGDATKKRKASSSSQKASKRKKKKRIDYWDVPLPPPGEDKDGDSTDDSGTSDDDSDDDAPLVLSSFRRMASSSSSSSYTADNSSSMLDGFAPVDLHVNERTRNYYVAAPTVMDARSFIFPICHDAVLYQRIKEVQASRRSIRRDVVDSTLMEVMKEEGALIGRWGTVDMFDAVLGGVANNNDESHEDGGGQSSSLTDKKKSNANTNKAQDKIKGADKKREAKDSSEKKSDNNIVAAGLLDTDVDPSWPGLNSLSRGRLW